MYIYIIYLNRYKINFLSDLTARFREIYLTSYLIGEGLSGFLPSLLALAQGVGGNPVCITTNGTQNTGELIPFYPPARFSVAAFFVMILTMMLGSALGFIGLDRSVIAKRQLVNRLPDLNSATPLHDFQVKSFILSHIYSFHFFLAKILKIGRKSKSSIDQCFMFVIFKLTNLS